MRRHHPYPVAPLAIRCLFGLILLGLTGCGQEKSGTERYGFQDRDREAPKFSGSEAVDFLEAQLQWGPRVPGSEAHRQTLEYLEETLSTYAGERSVYRQNFQVTGYEGDSLELS
ncbi:MAG: hypothetical protein ACQER4_10020, partial [Bacteroidota bacterium]